MTELTPAQRAEVLERHLHEHGHIHPEEIDETLAARERGEGASTAFGAAHRRPGLDRSRVQGPSPRRRHDDHLGVRQADDPDRGAGGHARRSTTSSCARCARATRAACWGHPPDWYKSFEYRSRVVREPRAVLAEFGMEVPEGVELRVVDSTSEQRYLVLPLRPEGTDGWSEEDLAALVTRDSMIGTGRPLSP